MNRWKLKLSRVGGSRSLVLALVVSAVGCAASHVRPCGLGGAAPGSDRAVDLAAGTFHTCALMANATMRCWGLSSLGEIGGQRVRTSCPLPSLADDVQSSILEIAAGHQSTMARTLDGSVLLWGSGAFVLNEIAGGSYPPTLPLHVPQLEGVRQLAVGGDFGCALIEDGTVRCWGRNRFGNLGDGTTIDRAEPVPVAAIDDATQVSAATAGACARRRDGTVWCWGSQTIATGSTWTTVSRPTRIEGLHDVLQIATGATTSCALLDDGSVQCWGDRYGARPQRIDGLTDVTQLAVGEFACARTRDGSVWCWNPADRVDASVGGMLGPNPRRIEGLSNVIKVVVGGGHACALQDDGAVRCWGNNDHGQLGNGTTESSAVPVAVQW